MRELLFMEPVFKEAIWGGTRLKDVFGYDIPSSRTGECWLSARIRTGIAVLQAEHGKDRA